MFRYLILGAVALAVVIWLGRRNILPLPTWRIGAGMGAVAVFAAAAFFAMRNAWPVSVTLVVVGLGLAVSTRSARAPRVHEKRKGRPLERRDDGRMSAAEARSILGVSETATREEINAAYKRLMVRVHPDNGGAPGLAVKLNAARDRLLKG